MEMKTRKKLVFKLIWCLYTKGTLHDFILNYGLSGSLGTIVTEQTKTSLVLL